MAQVRDSQFPTWTQPDGQPVGCRDKIKVLNENLEEVREMAQDALEDAILMGCDEGQVRQVLHQLMDGLENPYASTAGETSGGSDTEQS
ncbi:hypothetical protein [Rhodovibrio salinarum]|uniref:Uncharacterized protein n=1 Tax=Rhodovibrio salinarum TaxID=1087 RepID=A0A934QEW9_9PROT|nr:hypothetical protein [Rhodovibrio salinarum]MBK1695881.1 hypothetical protein [Rhodovibrio salinarum]